MKVIELIKELLDLPIEMLDLEVVDIGGQLIEEIHYREDWPLGDAANPDCRWDNVIQIL